MPGALGRRIQHDPRSRAYAYKAPRGVTYASVKHESHIGILDQGDTGSCVGNATVAAVGCDPLWAGNAGATLDETEALRIYSAATVLDDEPGTYYYPPRPDGSVGTDTGTSGMAGAKAAQQAGLISGYQHAFSVADALAALQQGPVITGIDWWSSFDQPTPAGLVSIRPGATVRGGHEVCADEYSAEHGLVWFRNSWGPSWGSQGRFSLTVATWTQLLANQGDCTILAPATAPAPTPAPGDTDLAVWWGATKDWANARHAGSNHTAALAARTLATRKGLS